MKKLVILVSTLGVMLTSVAVTHANQTSENVVATNISAVTTAITTESAITTETTTESSITTQGTETQTVDNTLKLLLETKRKELKDVSNKIKILEREIEKINKDNGAEMKDFNNEIKEVLELAKKNKMINSKLRVIQQLEKNITTMEKREGSKKRKELIEKKKAELEEKRANLKLLIDKEKTDNRKDSLNIFDARKSIRVQWSVRDNLQAKRLIERAKLYELHNEMDDAVKDKDISKQISVINSMIENRKAVLEIVGEIKTVKLKINSILNTVNVQIVEED
jgi:hypothetical protein